MAVLRIPLTIQVQVGDDIIRAVALQRFEALRKDGTLERVARRVLTETVLVAYRRKVLQMLPVLLTPDLEPKQGIKIEKIKLLQKTQKDYLAALSDRDSAVLDGRGRTKIERLDARLRRLQRGIAKELQRTGPRAFSTGQYRERLFQVLNSLTDPEQINIYWDNGILSWQIGNTRKLEAARFLTPSYITQETGKTFGKALMWKQLVYGAGVYNEDPRRRRKKPWKFLGIRIKGIRGVNLKVQYDEAALGYREQLLNALTGALRGDN